MRWPVRATRTLCRRLGPPQRALPLLLRLRPVLADLQRVPLLPSLKMATPRLSLRLASRTLSAPRFAAASGGFRFACRTSAGESFSSRLLALRRSLITTPTSTEAPAATLESASFEGAPQPVRPNSCRRPDLFTEAGRQVNSSEQEISLGSAGSRVGWGAAASERPDTLSTTSPYR